MIYCKHIARICDIISIFILLYLLYWSEQIVLVWSSWYIGFKILKYTQNTVHVFLAVYGTTHTHSVCYMCISMTSSYWRKSLLCFLYTFFLSKCMLNFWFSIVCPQVMRRPNWKSLRVRTSRIYSGTKLLFLLSHVSNGS